MGDHRNSSRKQIIERLFATSSLCFPVLLDEVLSAWLLLEGQLQDRPPRKATRSIQVSFARTIRDHMPSIHLAKSARVDRLHLGIVSRAAVFRIKDHAERGRFLESSTSCMLVSVRTSADTQSGRPRLLCEPCERFPLDATGEWDYGPCSHCQMPYSSPLTVLTHEDTTVDWSVLSRTAPWPIYIKRNIRRVSFKERFRAIRVDPTESFRASWRQAKAKGE